ncbi:MAG: hypothetical protein CM15mP39_11790 [Synechococcus sp.]|nr:MAG: hypothetical protein CM15mP39_11790 [Synechococcus sp.]
MKGASKGLSFLPCQVFCLVCPSERKQGLMQFPAVIPPRFHRSCLHQIRCARRLALSFLRRYATIRHGEASFRKSQFIRAYETFLTMMPAASMKCCGTVMNRSVDDHTKVNLMSPLNSNPLFLTGNTDTVYGSLFSTCSGRTVGD